MKRVIILKLGGSAITEKTKECTPNIAVIQQAVEEVAKISEPLILLHGGGSYAHPTVTRMKLRQGYKHLSQLRSISETELYLDQLTRIIGVCLLFYRRAFVPLRPMSFLALRKGEIESSFVEPIKSALHLGLVPLIHGDLAFDFSKSFGVISADKLASFLGTELETSKVLFGCDVDGVYTDDPKTSRGPQLVPEIDKSNADSILQRLSKSPRADATGGMFGKVREAIQLARAGRECYIFNLKKTLYLRDAIRGKSFRATKFPPW